MSGPSNGNRASKATTWLTIAGVGLGSAVVGGSLSRGGKGAGASPAPGSAVSVLAGYGAAQHEGSPFSAIKFQEVKNDAPIVSVKLPAYQPDRWFRVVQIDGVPIATLYASALEEDPARPQKRLAEDLKAVFKRSGRELGATASLQLQDEVTGQEVSLEGIPVTQDNRILIRAARKGLPEEKRETTDGSRVTLPPVPSTLSQKLSPFNAIRWEGEKAEVKVDGNWFKLISIDGVPAAEILTFCRSEHGDKWQQRFAEDLVQVLAEMGHPPDAEVRLVLQSLTSPAEIVKEKVPMTAENRRAIREAAASKESAQRASNQKARAREAVPIENADLFCARVEEFLTLARARVGFSGAVIVAKNGIPVYQGAFGFSDTDSKTKNTLDTPFRIASLSKQFTAAAVLHLEAQGKLSVNDPVHLYLKEFEAEPYRQITIYQLLTHTSGLPRIADDGARWAEMSRKATPVEDFVRLACSQQLRFSPGANFEYSNFSYRVLSALITKVSGQGYADFMETGVFGPLGMDSAGVARVANPANEKVVAQGLSFTRFDQQSGEPRYLPGDQNRNFGTGYGSGGIYVSANDLLRWDRALASDELLPKSQREKLFTPHKNDYACGWIVKTSGLDGRVYQTHDGANEGSFSKMMRVPESNLVIIAVGNVDLQPGMEATLQDLFLLCRSLPYQEPPEATR